MVGHLMYKARCSKAENHGTKTITELKYFYFSIDFN